MAAAVLADLVGGEFRASNGGTPLPSVNPSDASDVVALVPEGSADAARAAADAAAAALGSWRGLSGPARAEHLYTWAAVVAERADELARAMTREVGKPIAESRGEVARAVVILRYYAGEAVRAAGEVIPAQAPGALQFTLR